MTQPRRSTAPDIRAVGVRPADVTASVQDGLGPTAAHPLGASRGGAVLRYGLLGIAALALVGFYHALRLPLDLHVYVSGGQAVLDGRNLYGESVVVDGYPFTYPPFAAMPFAVLAALPVWLTIGITCAVFYGCLALVVQVSSPGLLRRVAASWSAWLTVAATLAFNPVWATLKDGQVNMILAALVLGDLLCLRRGRGALVGVAAAIKLTPAVFVLYLIVTRQWVAARNATLGFAACTALAWLVLPADSSRFWIHDLYETSRIGSVGRVSNQSLLGLATKEFSSTAAVHGVWIVLSVTAAAVALWTARHLHADDQEVLALGIVGVLGCLLSPITWTHHWVWVVPLFLGILASPAWRHRLCRAAVVVGAVVFVHGASAPAPNIAVLHLVLGNLYTMIGLATIATAAWVMRVGKAHDAPAGRSGRGDRI